jgi:hypothetical protein
MRTTASLLRWESTRISESLGTTPPRPPRLLAFLNLHLRMPIQALQKMRNQYLRMKALDVLGN